MRRKVLTNLKTMLSFAQRKGLVAQNAATAVRTKADERNTSGGPLRAGTDFPTRAELNSVIEASAGRWRPLVVTAIFTECAPANCAACLGATWTLTRGSFT